MLLMSQADDGPYAGLVNGRWGNIGRRMEKPPTVESRGLLWCGCQALVRTTATLMAPVLSL